MTQFNPATDGKTLVVVIPCLNEEKTVAAVIEAVPRDLPGIRETRIIVVDDGSEDGTAETAAAAGALVHRHPRNMGLGGAFRTGVEAALRLGADIIVNIDGDGQFNAKDIALLIGPVAAGKADFVTASRFKDAALVPVMPAVKKWGNRRIAELVSFLVKQRFYDVSCGFRAYTREAALHLNLMGRFTYTQETFLEMAFKGFRILEVPVKVRGEREFGTSRIASSLVNYAKNTAMILLRSYRDYHPFSFFALPGSWCFGAGLGLLAFFFGRYLVTGQFTGQLWAGFTGGALVLAGLLLFLVAILADMMVRISRTQERLLYHEKVRSFGKKDER